MERIVEDRRIDGHRVVIVEDVTDEGSGFLLFVDDIVLNGNEPLGRVPSDGEVRALMRARGVL